jgi:hypothetical protein
VLEAGEEGEETGARAEGRPVGDVDADEGDEVVTF